MLCVHMYECASVCGVVCIALYIQRWGPEEEIQCPPHHPKTSLPYSLETESLDEHGALRFFFFLATPIEPPVFPLCPGARVIDVQGCAQLYTWILGIWAQISCFQNKSVLLTTSAPHLNVFLEIGPIVTARYLMCCVVTMLDNTAGEWL